MADFNDLLIVNHSLVIRSLTRSPEAYRAMY
jgi:hypothetical protein